jgi:hypothetical protein
VREKVLDTLEVVRSLSDTLEAQAAIVLLDNVAWNDVSSTINSGNVLISLIKNTVNERSIEYSDSATVWGIPLDMNSKNSSLQLTIDKKEYDIAFSYTRTTDTDEKGRVVIHARDVLLINSDFDSTSVNCNNCLDTNTTVYVEF